RNLVSECGASSQWRQRSPRWRHCARHEGKDPNLPGTMESAIRGLVLDSSVLVAAERAKLTTPEVLRNIRATAEVGDAPIVISVMTGAELAHGIYAPNPPERRARPRQFADEQQAQ